MLAGILNVVRQSVHVNNKCTEVGVFVDSCKFTSFGLCVKTELLKRGKTQRWLEDQIKPIGMYMDGGYMYKILTGQRNAPKVVHAIRSILELQGVLFFTVYFLGIISTRREHRLQMFPPCALVLLCLVLFLMCFLFCKLPLPFPVLEKCLYLREQDTGQGVHPMDGYPHAVAFYPPPRHRSRLQS